MLSALSSFAVSFLVRLAMDVFQDWQAKRAERSAGRAEAVWEGEAKARASVNITREVEAETAAVHRADPTDGAFDPDFMRAD